MKILSLILLLVPIFSISPENITNITKNTILSDLILQNQEHIFEYYGILPFIIFTLGCFMILYGAYYNYYLIMKVTLFLYYIISIFISFKEDTIRRDLLFILLFSFISGVLIYIIYKSQIKFFESHMYIKKIVYGAITGCFLNQIIFHFIYVLSEFLISRHIKRLKHIKNIPNTYKIIADVIFNTMQKSLNNDINLHKLLIVFSDDHLKKVAFIDGL